MTKMTDFLDDGKVKEEVSIQGYVATELRSAVQDQMATDKKAGLKVTWNSFLEAACKAYLAERAAERAPKRA